MIEDLYLSYTYWLLFILALFIGIITTKARFFDFKFLVIFILSQYLAHSFYFFYTKNLNITIFSFLFFAIFIVFYKLNPVLTAKRDISLIHSNWNAIEKKWVLFCKSYLFIYYFTKFLSTPFLIGELVLVERLAAQNENRTIFYMGLVVFPAITACMYDWIKNKFRFKLIDLILIFIITLGLIGSASKSALLPLVLAYFGATSYMRIKPVRARYLYSAICILFLLSYGLLRKMFPSLDIIEILKLIAFRIVANSDSLEYIYILNISPGEYKFSGVGALFPSIAKIFGYAYDYSPGVWLHGLRYGVWDGYGPNSGLIMDYYANLSWFGLSGAIFLALYLRWCLRLKSAIGCSFLSIAYLSVIDISMFNVSAIFYGILISIFILFYSFLMKLKFFKSTNIIISHEHKI